MPGTFIILFKLHEQAIRLEQLLFPPYSKETNSQGSDLLKVIELDSGRDQIWSYISPTLNCVFMNTTLCCHCAIILLLSSAILTKE